MQTWLNSKNKWLLYLLNIWGHPQKRNAEITITVFGVGKTHAKHTRLAILVKTV